MENTYYDVSPYDVTFSFANQEINGVAKGITKDVDGYSYLQILFEKRGVNYLISIEANKYYNKAPEKLINLIEVVELMNDYIYFYD